jgi:hypothetical protein
MAELKRQTVLPIATTVMQYMNDGAMIEKAKAIAQTARKGGRTLKEVEDHFLIGFAIEHALLEYLLNQGWRVSSPPVGMLQYDGIITDQNGFEIFVDVKTRLDGKTWEQSSWEAIKLAETKERVAYLCVDVMPNGDFIFKGFSWSDELAPSIYGSPFVQLRHLKDLVVD